MSAPPIPRRRVASAVAAGALVLACAACSSEQALYSQLSERQANEMVAVLLSAGIKAEKQTVEGRFSVSTSQADFPSAVRTLNAQGYPRDTFDSMGKVFKREGFVSSPLEERARLTHAMSQEIASTIANIDGVVTARVHLVMPENNPLIDKPQPSAAAVFIKHRPDRNLQSQVTQIKALVVNSIEGLKYANVTVALFPAEGMPNELPASPPRVPAKDGASDKASKESVRAAGVPMIAGGFGMIGVVSLGAGLLLSWRRRAANVR
jgi:type III secretion protein J